jgi:hypothetical protein
VYNTIKKRRVKNQYWLVCLTSQLNFIKLINHVGVAHAQILNPFKNNVESSSKVLISLLGVF